MGRASPRKIHRYSLEFKRQAVKLSQLEGVEVQAVAAHALLQQEHELLKKAIRFCSARKRTSSPSSGASEERSQ